MHLEGLFCSTKGNIVMLAFITFFLAILPFFLLSKLPNSTATSENSMTKGDDRPRFPQKETVGMEMLRRTITFTPHEFRKGRVKDYINLPIRPTTSEIENRVLTVMKETVPPPAERLIHKAHNPPGRNSIVGLASYPEFMSGWRKMVGSLRRNGYDGHIIMGVNKDIPEKEKAYLNLMGVTYYAVETSNCSSSILEATGHTTGGVRGFCSSGLEDLKLEWGRYEMARRWLYACDTCTGWSMVIDTRDIFFQDDPFVSLGESSNATHDLLFVEEIAPYTNTQPDSPHRAISLGESRRYQAHVEPCYTAEKVRIHELRDRPMLCSGTVIGTRDGIHRFLTVLVDEFRKNNAKGPLCRSPATTDQWTMNYLYYNGRFGFVNKTKTLPWGTGPVLTVGTPCVNRKIQNAKEKGSQIDLMMFDEKGLILNPHEKKDSPLRVAPTLHQWDRCIKWINPWFNKHKELFMGADDPANESPMPWVANT